VQGIAPSYEEKHFDAADKQGRLRLIASSDGREGSVTIHQDAAIYAGILNGDERAEHGIKAGRRGYVHVIRGRVEVNGVALSGGDALKIGGQDKVVLEGAEAAEVLVFDLP
jgi:redox-sensitive bicupin YhaK (pirin superfamily)